MWELAYDIVETIGVNETTQNVHIMRNGQRTATSTINGEKKKEEEASMKEKRKEVGEV